MKIWVCSVIVLIGIVLLVPLAIAVELHVPSEYATIQAAISACSNGDVVIIAPGTYTGTGNHDIDFLGKVITVRSTDPNDPCIIAATIIDCQGTNHRGFKFISNEGRATILEGLTITGANIEVMCEGGAGIYINGASPTINKCAVTSNHAQLVSGSLCFCFGGGIFIGTGSNPLITNCIINGNSVGNWGYGGGICGYYSTQATISNCFISNNTASGYESMGGGIYGSDSGLTVVNCTIVNNDGGGVCWHATIKDSILWDNSPYQIYAYYSTDILATYCDIEGGWDGTGNINADPYFITGPLGVFYLSQIAAGQSSNSPCVDAGSDTAANLKMDLKTTRTDGFGDIGTVDMGYHYILIINSDLNGNAFVDFVDYALFADDWHTSPDPCDPNNGDIIKNGWVDINDLAELCAQWLTCLVTKANSPIPADGANDVNLIVILRWSSGENVVSHDIYFGTDFNEIAGASVDNTTVYKGNQGANSWDINNFDVNGLEPNKSYYWRIDEVARCTAKGNVWRFKTDPRLPGQANKWKIDARCFIDGPSGAFDDISVKDPSIVSYGGKYHLFYTGRDSSYWRMGYASATTISGLNTATRYYMSALSGGSYFCAPQVFWVEAKGKWYLIYQSGQAATYSTNTDIGNPGGWTVGQGMGFGSGCVDFWCISDGTNVYCFYSPQDGSYTIRRRSTSVANFPTGWSGESSVCSNTFEAPHVYKNKADGKYYMMVEDLYRHFELWTANNPGGTWTKIDENWAIINNCTFNADHWTDQISHGEILRSGTNERMEISNINHCEILIQGMPAGNYGDYANWPYDLGLIRNY